MEGNILLFIQENVRKEWLDPVVIFITGLGDKGIFWVLVTALLFFFRRTRKTAFMCLVSLVQVLCINNLFLKNIVCRVRPYEAVAGLVPLVAKPSDWSFPSGHSACAFAAAVVLLFRMPKSVGVPAIVLAVLIALSRLYVGVHYPTDVLAGGLCGIIFAVLSVLLVNYICKVLEAKKK